MALFSGLQYEAGCFGTSCSSMQSFVWLEEFTPLDQPWLFPSSASFCLTTFVLCEVVLNEPFLPGDRGSCQTLTEENSCRIQVSPLGSGFKYLGPPRAIHKKPRKARVGQDSKRRRSKRTAVSKSTEQRRS
ncbi:hypothetical protein QOT17_016693 [Balamuthia mandrillaris]